MHPGNSVVEPVIGSPLSNSPVVENDVLDSSTVDTSSQSLSGVATPPPQAVSSSSSTPIVPLPRWSTRQHHPSAFLKDYHCHLLQHESPLTDSHTAYPFDKYLSYEKLYASHRHFLLIVSTEFKPAYYHQAVKFSPWRKAMDDEIMAMERINT